MSAKVILQSTEGEAEIQALDARKLKITLHPSSSTTYIPRRECVTSLPLDIIAEMMDLSFPWLCDWLSRHEEYHYVGVVLERQLRAYLRDSDLKNKRILDFGCGSGASTLWLAQLAPGSEIIGVDFHSKSIELARRIARARKIENAIFVPLPDPKTLPNECGRFDYIVLCAVYEHLLPDERKSLLPQIWKCLQSNGILFINQTPYRWFPLEHHSTGLWLINYMPDRIAHVYARRCARINRNANRAERWEEHLRGGIRGGTEWEVLRILRAAGGGKPCVLQPLGQDRASYWLSCTRQERYRLLKLICAQVFRWTDRVFGTIPAANLDVAIQKIPQ